MAYLGKRDLSAVDQKSRNAWMPTFAYLFQRETGGKTTDTGILWAWMAWIIAESGKTIYGNNPMNLTCRSADQGPCYDGQIGYYQFPGNSRKFAEFATPQDGARAVVALLKRAPRDYGYWRIVAAAQNSDLTNDGLTNGYGWQRMLGAISHSAWVNGSASNPGYVDASGDNKLFGYWTTVRKLVPDPTGAIKGVGTNVNTMTGMLDDWLRANNIDRSTVITTETLDKFYAYVVAKMGADPTMANEFPHGSLIGKTWGDAFGLLSKMDGPPIDPMNIPGAPDWGAALVAIAGLFAKLLDPNNWIKIGAMLLGLILSFTGFRMVMDASGGVTA